MSKPPEVNSSVAIFCLVIADSSSEFQMVDVSEEGIQFLSVATRSYFVTMQKVDGNEINRFFSLVEVPPFDCLIRQDQVFEASFIVEASKPHFADPTDRNNVIKVDLDKPPFVGGFTILPLNSEVRSAESENEYCDCKATQGKADIVRVECKCKISGIKIGVWVLYRMVIELYGMCAVQYLRAEGNF